MQTPQPVHCPKCGKPSQLENIAFCPYCGTAMNEAPVSPVPAGAEEWLKKVQSAKDPRKKNELLVQAEKEYPDCLEIAQERLFLGRLYERSAKAIDFSVIKCYLYQLYLTPEAFSDTQRRDMRIEFFEHPQLKRCQSLAPNAERFMAQYLQKLSEEFVRLFLRGSNQYMHNIMGFSLDSRASKHLAQPTFNMLLEIRKDPVLSQEQKDQLYAALYRGFCAQLGNDTKWLDELLVESGCPVPAKA